MLDAQQPPQSEPAEDQAAAPEAAPEEAREQRVAPREEARPAGEPPRKRQRQPKSEAQLRRDRALKVIQRHTERLATGASLEELEAAAEAARAGSDAAPRKGAAEAKAPEKAPEKKAQPDPSEVELWKGAAESLAKTLAGGVAGTRFAMAPEVQEELGSALAPVLAKYGPVALTSPEARLGMVLVAWLAKPTAELVAEKLAGGNDKPGAPAGAGVLGAA